MFYTICFIASALILSVGVLISSIRLIHQRKTVQKNNIEKNIHHLFIVTFLTVYVLVFPVNRFLYSGIFESAVMSGIYSLKVFTTGASFADFTKALADAPEFLLRSYSVFGAFLFVLAPVIGVGFLLSFFKQTALKIRLYFGLYNNLYIFSGMSNEAVSLAKSCVKNDKRKKEHPIVVFANTDEKKNVAPNNIPAIVFKNEIVNLNCLKEKNNKNRFAFVLGSENSKDLSTVLELMKMHKTDGNLKIYYFDDTSKGDIVISSAIADDVKPTIRRINVPQSLVYNYLYHNNIFRNIYTDNSGNKYLNIKIFGLGKHGEEILKAYLWAGQMNDIELNIDVYDVDKTSEEKFYAKCPEIKIHNGKHVEGDAFFNLRFHSGFNVNLSDFDDIVSNDCPPSTIFIALGNDALNTDVAIKLRITCSRKIKEFTPEIIAVIKDSNEAEIINDYLIKNEKGKPYQITAFADLSSTYSYEVIIGSELENAAIERHLLYVESSDIDIKKAERIKLFKYEYFLKSSMSGAIRQKLRLDYGVKGSDKPLSERTEEEKDTLRRIEHNGWNNYMRCEGYIQGEKNDFAKTHNCLVPFDKLSEEDKIKDDI